MITVLPSGTFSLTLPTTSLFGTSCKCPRELSCDRGNRSNVPPTRRPSLGSHWPHLAHRLALMAEHRASDTSMLVPENVTASLEKPGGEASWGHSPEHHSVVELSKATVSRGGTGRPHCPQAAAAPWTVPAWASAACELATEFPECTFSRAELRLPQGQAQVLAGCVEGGTPPRGVGQCWQEGLT